MGSNKKILLVDDDQKLIKALESFLKDMPYALFTASSGKEALKLLASESPELAILDLQMPDVNGIQILEAIRQNKYPVKTIVITSYSAEFIKALDELGPDALFDKPLLLEDIAKKAKELLGEGLPKTKEPKIKPKGAFRKLRLLFIEGDEAVFKAHILSLFSNNPRWQGKVEIKSVCHSAAEEELCSVMKGFDPDIVLVNTATCQNPASFIDIIKKSAPRPKDIIPYETVASTSSLVINKGYFEHLQFQIEKIGAEWGILAKTERTKSVELKRDLTVEDRVRQVLYGQFQAPIEAIKLKSRLVEDLGMDSLDVMEIVMALEEEFEIEILDKEVDEIATVEEIVKYIERRLKSR